MNIIHGRPSLGSRKIFDSQLQIIEEKKLAKAAELEHLYPHLNSLVGPQCRLDIRGVIPFLIIVIDPSISLDARMTKVLCLGQSGINCLRENPVDVGKTPPKTLFDRGGGFGSDDGR